MHVRDIKRRSQTNPNLNWQEMNVLIEALKGLDKQDARVIQGDTAGKSIVKSENEEDYIRAKPHTNIPGFSVFDIEEGNPTLERYFTTSKTRANTSNNELFATFGEYPASAVDYQKLCRLIGTHRPRLVAYSGVAPTSGDIVGPVPGAYTVSKLYQGLQVVGDIDVTNSRCWVIRSVAGATAIVRFKLKAILPLGGKSTAIEIKTGTGYEEVGEVFPIKDPWDDPGSWREDLLTHTGTGGAPNPGYRGFCIIPAFPEIDSVSGKPFREIIWMEQIAESIDFTLTTDMALNAALCTIDKYYLGKDPAKVFAQPMNVYDPQNLFPRALAGCKGKARYNNRENKYEIVTCDQMVLFMRCTAGAAMCPGQQASLTAHSRISWQPYGKMPATLPTLADNPLNLSCMAGAALTILYNDSAAMWQVENVGHYEESLVTGVSSSSCGLGYTSKPYSIQKCRDDVGGGSIPFVSHTYLSTIRREGCKIIAKQGTLCALGVVNAIDGPEIIFDEKDVFTGISVSDTSATASGTAGSQCVINGTKERVCVLTPAVPTITLVPILTAKPVLIVQDNRLNGLCLEQYVSVAYVICAEGGAWEPWTCGTVCIGSGSGSGSGGGASIAASNSEELVIARPPSVLGNGPGEIPGNFRTLEGE